MPEDYTIDGTTYTADQIELVPNLDGTYAIRLVSDHATLVGATLVALPGISIVEPALVGPHMLSYDHVSGKMVRVHGNSHGGVYVNPQMPSKGIGRTKRELSDIFTASGQLLTFTDPFHLVDLDFSGINASVNANTRFRLREGSLTGPVKYTFQHGAAAVGAPEHFSGGRTWSEHPIFVGSLWLELVSGTLTIAINLQGYEVGH